MPSVRRSGRFLARVAGETSGNVLLRRAQYRTADDPAASCRIARSMIFGKVYNARWSIERTRRDHGLRLDAASADRPPRPSDRASPPKSPRPPLWSICAGLEGAGATAYFGVVGRADSRHEKPVFSFRSRSRRPPLDPVNALLSFAYSLLRQRLRLRTGERGAGFLCGLPPPGSPWPGLSGPGSDGGAARACLPTGLSCV